MIANWLMRIIERDFSPHKMENPHTIGIYPVHHYPYCSTRPVCTVCVNMFMFLVHMCIYIYIYVYKYMYENIEITIDLMYRVYIILCTNLWVSV